MRFENICHEYIGNCPQNTYSCNIVLKINIGFSSVNYFLVVLGVTYSDEFDVQIKVFFDFLPREFYVNRHNIRLVQN